jgi:hypothetical protein
MIKLVTFQGCKSINKTQLINRIKDKNHKLISIDAGKALVKTQYPFMIKALQKQGIEEMYLILIKSYIR